MDEHNHTNKLINEKSPYLLQHALNPVNWFPWADEAFEKAKAEDKPIFLSIGYSTCHWCHVMERESFEDEEIAALLNRDFIAIKVDREERPDVDHVYMEACQAMTGSGGWPLTIIATPDKKPFFTATYIPKENRYGMAGLRSILGEAARLWGQEREALEKTADEMTVALSSMQHGNNAAAPDHAAKAVNIAQRAFETLENAFDEKYGGFGTQPKFSAPVNLHFLLRYNALRYSVLKHEDLNCFGHAVDMVRKTLDAMSKGGIYDHIGLGFSRYSTDRRWLVPHFEKMLYDNAQLCIAYLEVYQVTGIRSYAKTAEEILEYVLRDMTSPEGAFYSAEDADSEGVEGKFYLWSRQEIIDALGAEKGSRFADMYDITERGNFEGSNIPNLINCSFNIDNNVREFAEECRKALFAIREKRAHPLKDDKILTAWNGLMIAAMASAGRILHEGKYIDAARKAVSFIKTHLLISEPASESTPVSDNRLPKLMARYRDGEAAYPGYCDDYVFLVWGLIELYEATFDNEYIQLAKFLAEIMLRLFWDEQNGGLYFTSIDGEELINRPKQYYDGAIPSANSVAALNLIRLSRITGVNEFEDKAATIIESARDETDRNPTSRIMMLSAMMYRETGGMDISVNVFDAGKLDEKAKGMIEAINNRFLPFAAVKIVESADQATNVTICEQFTCKPPITDIDQLKEALD